MAEQSENERLRKEIETLLGYGLSLDEAAADLGGFVQTIFRPSDRDDGNLEGGVEA